jgi:hypothetical protein
VWWEIDGFENLVPLGRARVEEFLSVKAIPRNCSKMIVD